jgi:hypothetical protein
VKSDKRPVNKKEMSLFDAACLVLLNIQRWCAIQVSNLQRPSKTKGKSKGDAQRDAQRLVPLGHDLSRVVAAWSKLPCPLKAAILAIVKSANASQEVEP